MKPKFCIPFLLFLCFNIVSAQNQELIAKYHDSVKAYYKDFVIKGYDIHKDNYQVEFRGSKMRIEYDDHSIGNEIFRMTYEADLKNIIRTNIFISDDFGERKRYKIISLAMLEEDTEDLSASDIDILSSDNKDWSFYSVCIDDLPIYRYLMKLIWEYSN